MQVVVSSQDLHNVRKNAKRTRASAACARCKASKTKCSGYWPCKRCNDSNVACCFDSRPFDSSSQKRKAQDWSEPPSVEPFQSWSPHVLTGFSEFKGSMTNQYTMGYGQVGQGLGSSFEGKVTGDLLKSDDFTSTTGASMDRIEVGWTASLIPNTLNPARNNRSWMTPTTQGEIWLPTATYLPDLLETLRSFG